MSNHNLQSIDAGRHLRIEGADSAVNLRIDDLANDTNLPWSPGTYFEIYNNLATGTVTVVPLGGQIINQASGTLIIANQKLARLYLTDIPNTWDMFIIQTTGGGGGSPGGLNRQIQFNNAGAFGGIADFEYNSVLRSLQYNPTPVAAAGDVALYAANSTAPGNVGGNVFLTAGDGSPAGIGGAGGDIELDAGAGNLTGNGGNITLLAGSAVASGNGGQVSITSGGSVTGNGGAIGVTSASATSSTANGGDINLSAGQTTNGLGGNIIVAAGWTNGATGTGGHVTIQGGIKTSTGTPGYVSFDTDNTERFRILSDGAWSLGNTGTAVGTAGQVLTSAGVGAVPTWSPPSAGSAPLNEVVVGNGGGTTSSPAFTYNYSTNTLLVGTLAAAFGQIVSPANTDLYLNPGQAASGYAGEIDIIGAENLSGTGGTVYLSGGNGTTGGGLAFLIGGFASAGPGAAVNITGGSNSDTTAVGGDAIIQGGQAGGSGAGGAALLSGGGSLTGPGGLVTILGGPATDVAAAGGNVLIQGGIGGASNLSGNVQIQTNSTTAVEVDQFGNVSAGLPSLATSATDGFVYIPTTTGTPTGAPTAKTGFAPMLFDTGANKLWIYNGAAWKFTTLT